MSVIVTELNQQADAVREIRRGRIRVVDGKFESLRPRWFGGVSIARVWWDIAVGRGADHTCEIDFHVPRGLPGFITLDYIRAGRTAGYKTMRQCVLALEQVAQIRGTQAIVGHITNPLISDRLLSRFGWQRHCLHWRGRHWIRRLDHPGHF